MRRFAALTALSVALFAAPALADRDAIDGIIEAADLVEEPSVQPVGDELEEDLDSMGDTGEASDAVPPGPLPSGASAARFQFTSAVDAREPIDSLKTLSSDAGDTSTVYFFSELLGLEGRRVTHRWEFAGNVMAEVPFEVGGPRWRVHSSKQIPSDWTGRWTVSVVDESGEVLAIESLDVTPPAAPMAESESDPALAAPPAAPALTE